MIADKFKMGRDESIYLAKRLMVDSIWKSANLEGIAVTFPDTQTIFDGHSVSGYRVDELIAINNLKRGWYFILENIDYKVDFNYICKINQIVGGDDLINRAGKLRDFDVAIGGTSWRPQKPVKEEIDEELKQIAKIEGHTDRAISMMLYLMRKHMFYDGNKRTAQLTANQIMIQENVGLISIPLLEQSAFTKKLVDYYETGDDKNIKNFVFTKCILGFEKYSQNKGDEAEL